MLPDDLYGVRRSYVHKDIRSILEEGSELTPLHMFRCGGVMSLSSLKFDPVSWRQIESIGRVVCCIGVKCE